MSDKKKLKDLGRKPKILWVNEASFLRTGFSTYGWQVMQRLQATGKYEIVELASYATQTDPRWKDPRWGISWKYYGVMPEPQDQAANQAYQQNYYYNQFGKWKFDEICMKEKPDIVIEIRDRWMASEWQLKSTYRKYFTYVYMPCVDSHPPMPDWIQDYKDSDYILGYSWYAKHVLERNGIKCHHVTNPGVDPEVYNRGDRAAALERWCFRKDVKPILCVHRNQKRKLLPDMIYSYLILKNEDPQAFKNTVLWFHTSWPDVGFNIPVTMDRAKMGMMPCKDAHGKLKEKRFKNGLKYSDVVFSYICHACGHTFVSPYVNGMVQVKDTATGDTQMTKLTCDLIYCQKCGKKEARMPNTQVGFNPEDFADVYRAAYVHVQPAIAGADEMPINEAKACGTPVIAPVHAAMHEKVEKTNYCEDDRYKGGLPIKLDSLYTEAETMQHRCIFSKEHLAKQLKKVLTDKPLRDRLSEEAVEVSEKYYNWDDVAEKWDNFLWETVEVDEADNKSWHAPAQMKEYGNYVVPTPEQMSDGEFVNWCYSFFLKVDKPDDGGFQYWMQDIAKGRQRENIIEFFKQQADEHNKKELFRTGQAVQSSEKKISEFVDPEDRFRIIVVLPKTAGDIHLLTGTLKSLYEKYNRQEPWGIYVSCEPVYHDILKNLSFVKGLLPYSPQIDNAKALEQSGLANIALTPHIATQLREHYVHRGHGKHLGQVYADMCGVPFGQPEIDLQKFDGLPAEFYVMHCKTSMPSKDWPISRFASVARLFPDVTFVQVGSSKDPQVEAPNVVDLRGKTTFRQLAYVIRKAEGVLGLDSIALHLASTVGTRSLGIFAATYPNICGPINSHGGGSIMPSERTRECPEPCHMVQCPNKANPCITHISVRQVASAMEQVFGDNDAGS